MDKLDIDKLTETVGGRFKLTYLIQKRMRELERGHPPLIDDVEGMHSIQIAAEEVARGKIRLVTGEEARKLRELRRKGTPAVEGGES